MTFGTESEAFLAKAAESMASARSEFVNGRYNSCANRCYFACFQAAVAALVESGLAREGNQLSHAFVQAQFAGQLVNRRKEYAPQLRDTLSRLVTVRHTADYRAVPVNRTRAGRALYRAQEFVGAVISRGGGNP
jgi:uncharacterized protein (UPF0332 family)